LDIAAQCKRGTLRQAVLRVLHNLANFGGHAAKVSLINVCVDIEVRLKVVVIGVTSRWKSATFPSNWLAFPCGEVMGVRERDCRESMRYCGVCTTTW